MFHKKRTLAVVKPSLKSMFSAIKVKSGSIIDTGRSIAFRFSGSSLRPAYPGFIVTNIPHVRISRISTPTDGILTYKMIPAAILSKLAYMWTFCACRPGEITPSYILHTRAFGTYLLGMLFTLQKRL